MIKFGLFSVALITSMYTLSMPLTIITDIDPPAQFYDKQGRLTGFGIDLVTEIQTRVGNEDNIISIIPWARAYDMIQNQPKVVLFLMARNKQRNDKFQWVGPVLEFTFGLYGKSESKLEINSIADARKIRSIGVYKDDVRDKLLTSMGFKNLERVNYNLQNVKMLMNDRIDLYAASSISFWVDAEEAGYKPSDVKLVYAFHSVQAYIAMSADVPQHTVNQWNNALNDMIAEGVYSKILKQYYPTASPPNPAITTFE